MGQETTDKPFDESLKGYDKRDRLKVKQLFDSYFGYNVFLKDALVEDKKLDLLIELYGLRIGIELECLQKHWLGKEYPYNRIRLIKAKADNGIKYYAELYKYRKDCHLYIQVSKDGKLVMVTDTASLIDIPSTTFRWNNGVQGFCYYGIDKYSRLMTMGQLPIFLKAYAKWKLGAN